MTIPSSSITRFIGILGLLPCFLLALCISVGADQPKPFPNFEAKRVLPPADGVRRRITVQIAPETQAGSEPEAQPDKKPIPQKRYGWFWQNISPALEDGNSGRLPDIYLALQGPAGSVPAPRLAVLQKIVSEFGVDILKATVGTEVSPALVLAVIAVESAGNPGAISSVGAQGLMQLMPETAKEYGVQDPLLPEDNIGGGVAYLNALMKQFENDPILVLAAYNAGPGAVRRHGGVPDFAETRNYVPKVLAAFQVARGLCITPPELVSDGCVFSTMR